MKKVLQICLRMPFPPREGGSMAMVALAEGLRANDCDVTVFALNTSKHFVAIEDVPKNYIDKFSLIEAPINNDITPINTALNLLGDKSFHVCRFYSKTVDEQLKELLQKESFDFIVFESIFTAVYLQTVKSYSQGKTVLRSHNVEYLIWERVLENTTNPFKKWYLSIQKERLKQFEIETSAKFDVIACISPTDQVTYQNLGLSNAKLSIPFGILPIERKGLAFNHKELRLCFLGSMDWIPNIEGVEWFLKDIWPSLQELFPQLKLHLAGRFMPSKIFSYQSNRVVIESEVANSKEFLANHHIMVVPLLSGSGIRIKVLEALAHGLAVVSTSVGYEGIEARNGYSIMKANTKEEWINHIRKCINEDDYLAQIRANGLSLIKEKYNRDQLAACLITYLQEH